MKKIIIKMLLSILNSSFLNGTPCKYEFVGNKKSFTRSFLEASSDLTVRQFLADQDQWEKCGATGCTVHIGGADGVCYKGADILHDELSKGL